MIRDSIDGGKRSLLKIAAIIILSGILSGAAISILEFYSITVFTGISWVLDGFMPITAAGLAFGIGLAAAFIVFGALFPRIRRFRKPDNLSAALISAVLIYPFLHLAFLKQTMKINQYSFKGMVLLFIMFCLSFIIFWLAVDLLKIISRKIRMNWQVFTVMLILLSMGGAHVISGYMLPQKSYSEPYSEENSRKVKDKPYVIFIIIDTLRRDCVSAYGYDIRTPDIDRLARDGILMTDAVVNCSWTKPSIASMMTSLHPLQHNVLSYQAVINPELPTLARVMQETGYYTVGFHNNPQLNIASNFHLGFNRYEGFYTARHRDPRMPEFSLSEFYFRSILEIARKFGIKVFKPPLLYKPAEETSRTAIQWIKNNRDRKFFMFLHYIDPHNPYYYHPFNGKSESPPGWGASPPTFSDRLKILRDLYRGEVEYNDEALGTFFDYLKRINIYDSSLIMLVSDHGEEFYDHSGWSHGATLYEEQIRELFVLKEPFRNGSGAVDSSLVESMDIAPTLVAYVGGAVPDRWEGRDILKADTIRPTEPGPFDGWSLAITDWLKFTCTSLRSRDEKLYLVHYKDDTTTTVEYYDLRRDPLEKNDLSDDMRFRDRIKSLRDTLLYMEKTMSASSVSAELKELDKAAAQRLKGLGYIQY